MLREVRQAYSGKVVAGHDLEMYRCKNNLAAERPRGGYASPAGSVGGFAEPIAAAEFVPTLWPAVRTDSTRAKNVAMSHPTGAGGSFSGALSK